MCPNCGEAAKSTEKFCPHCGSELGEKTIADDCICTSCGTQNNIGVKFCTSCGTKLPAAIAEEQAAAKKNALVMAQWDEKLPQYPKWNCGGTDWAIDDYDTHFVFYARFKDNHNAARQAVEQYRQLLLQNGFRQAGQYPRIENLYKKIDSVCYHVDTEHCFDGDGDCPCIGFDISEPYGGFDYVKKEAPKKVSFRDLFNI